MKQVQEQLKAQVRHFCRCLRPGASFASFASFAAIFLSAGCCRCLRQADAAKRAEEERLKAFQEEQVRTRFIHVFLSRVACFGVGRRLMAGLVRQERLRKEAAAREERLKEKIALTLRPSDGQVRTPPALLSLLISAALMRLCALCVSSGQDPIKIVVARKVLVSKLLETAAKVLRSLWRGRILPVSLFALLHRRPFLLVLCDNVCAVLFAGARLRSE